MGEITRPDYKSEVGGATQQNTYKRAICRRLCGEVPTRYWGAVPSNIGAIGDPCPFLAYGEGGKVHGRLGTSGAFTDPIRRELLTHLRWASVILQEPYLFPNSIACALVEKVKFRLKSRKVDAVEIKFSRRESRWIYSQSQGFGENRRAGVIREPEKRERYDTQSVL